ncbi:MAG: toll/interleukin-1 receptor domain-containing protein [Methanomassiliicoccaceae archaeon]|jgi:hypothetical protein|nr:toll/interleukin-1 receptor domain-containing protein [Methanomassiliicoccaceae archaeon]
MNVKDKDVTSENYAIISYSHADTDNVMNELKLYDDNNVCYWFDGSMRAGGSFETQFFEKLDNKNCKGMIIFMCERFLLSKPCAEEMRYFFEKYGTGTKDKFCLFVMPRGNFPYSDGEMIYEAVIEYIERTNPDLIKNAMSLPKHIDHYLKLNGGGTAIYTVVGNGGNYIETACKDGVFHDAEIIFGHTQTNDLKFGYFPQTQNRTGSSEIEKKTVKRSFDKQPAYYSKVNWLIISDNDNSATLLSRDLLFTADYLNLKYPIKPSDKSVSDKIRELFQEHCVIGEDEKWTVKKVRFLTESELRILLARSQKEQKYRTENRSKLLLPKTTYFSQVSDRTNVIAFWLAGDMENARHVDTWKDGGLSETYTGVETFYVRIVIEVAKK